MRPIRCFRLLRLTSLLLLGALVPGVARAGYSLVGWNNLGMHCMDGDYSVLSLLPPYNTIHAQLVDPQGQLVTNPAGITVTYRAVADPDGSINTTSVGKTNFWENAPALFGVSLAPDVGLLGLPMPGSTNTPRAMVYDAASGWWIAEGIPITPYDDLGRKNPYPLMRLEARNAAGTLLSSVDVVLPVSDEMDCSACHASGSGSAALPDSGWENDPNAQRDFRLNVLRLHDEKQAGNASFRAALAAQGYDPAGLRATALGGEAILCASCHLSEALPGSGIAGIAPLTRAIHGRHAGVTDPRTSLTLDSDDNRSACYTCHPGSVTRCLRGAMGSAVAGDGTLAMQCQSCHGSMSAVASPARTGWLDEPTCQSCHTGTAVRNNGQIRYTSVFDGSGRPRVAVDATFATTPNTPAPGLSLFRFSKGHGGLACEACHGSTHAEFPSSHRNDNLASLQRQGHPGVLVECASCHGTQPETISGGPHGMHPVGQTWVGRHADASEEGGAAQCRTCHGSNDRGTVLSRSQADRTISTEFGSKHFWKGFQIGCYTCHRGPGSDDANPNRAAVASNGSAATAVDVPVSIALAASDADRDALSLRIVSQPAHGTAGLEANRATYFPDAAFSGTDSFTFAAWDGSTDSNLATVSVRVGGGGSGCSYALSPLSQAFGAAGGSGSVSVTTTVSCAWVAQSNAAWLRVDSGGSGSGAGTVRFSVGGNPASGARVATISIANQSFGVTQAGTVAAAVCTPEPTPECRRSVASRAGSLVLKSASAAKRSLAWKWSKGAATSLADFGAPSDHDGYALCLYDESGSQPDLLFGAVAPAGDSCGAKPCWRPAGKSTLLYRDPAGTPDGLTALTLHAGSQGKAKLRAAASGASLALPVMPLPLPLRLQLQSQGGGCWEAEFSATGTKQNASEGFNAKPD